MPSGSSSELGPDGTAQHIALLGTCRGQGRLRPLREHRAAQPGAIAGGAHDRAGPLLRRLARIPRSPFAFPALSMAHSCGRQMDAHRRAAVGNSAAGKLLPMVLSPHPFAPMRAGRFSAISLAESRGPGPQPRRVPITRFELGRRASEGACDDRPSSAFSGR